MEGAQAAEKEREREREERRLMRQRGAGARELKDAKFAFGFKFPSFSSLFGFGRAASSSATSSTKEAREAPEGDNDGNKEEHEPEEDGIEDASIKKTATVEIEAAESQSDNKKTRKRPAAETGAKEKTAEVKKRARIVEVVDGEQAVAAVAAVVSSPDAKTLETKEIEKPKPRKRGRPAAGTTNKPVESRKRTKRGTVQSKTEDSQDQETTALPARSPVQLKRTTRSKRVAASARDESKPIEVRKRAKTSSVEPETENVKDQETIAPPIQSPVPPKRTLKGKRTTVSAYMGSQVVEFSKRTKAISVESETEDTKGQERIALPIHSPVPPKTTRSRRIAVSAHIDKDKIRDSDMEAVLDHNLSPPRIKRRKAKNNMAAAIDKESDVQLGKTLSETPASQVELATPTDKDEQKANVESVVPTGDDKQEDKDEEAAPVQSPAPKRRGKRSQKVARPVNEESVKMETVKLQSQPKQVKKQIISNESESSIQQRAPLVEDVPMKKRRGRPPKRLKADDQPFAISLVGEATINDERTDTKSTELTNGAAKEDIITFSTVESDAPSLSTTTIAQAIPTEKFIRKRGRKPTKKLNPSDPLPRSRTSAFAPPPLPSTEDIPLQASLHEEEPTQVIEQPMSSPSPTHQSPDGPSNHILNDKSESIPVKGHSTVIPSSQASLPSLSSSSTTLGTSDAVPASSLLSVAPRPINPKPRKGKALFFPSRSTQPLLSSREHYSLKRGSRGDAEKEEKEDMDWFPRPSVPKSLLLPSALSSSSTLVDNAAIASDTVPRRQG